MQLMPNLKEGIHDLEFAAVSQSWLLFSSLNTQKIMQFVSQSGELQY